ncbi:Uncharacterised protein [Shigella sonnei]|nr:Uncharacterised protein [Shigella sonnei]CSP88801.1 Uncharacterised protein [Shigella sonnei]
MIGIRIVKAVPLFAWRNGPAFGFIHLRRLPDIEKPTVRLFPQPLDLFAKMQRPLHRTVNQPFARITTQHRRRHLNRSNNGITGRGGGMHHKGFVKRLFVILAFNVDQRSLR